MTEPLTTQQLTPAEIRLAQYGERTSTWSTATYNDGTEKALHEIAIGLKEEIDRLRRQNGFLLRALAAKDAKSGDADKALREFLAADPDGDETADFTGSRPCGHDDYHDPHPWHERPGIWCPGISVADDEETHVVADSSDDPEHIDDCPGCETAAARPAATTQDGGTSA
ncbi:hypothetical protein [Streptomyces sp. YIM S03343]